MLSWPNAEEAGQLMLEESELDDQRLENQDDFWLWLWVGPVDDEDVDDLEIL